MKRKILSLFLCSVMLIGSVCGCESKNNLSNSPVITDISAEEWTTEKLCEAVLINGKNISPICTLREFGDEFEIDTNDELGLVYREDNKSATSSLAYNGYDVGSFGVMQCEGEDKVFDSPLSAMPQIWLKSGAATSILFAVLYAISRLVIGVISPLPVPRIVSISLKSGSS